MNTFKILFLFVLGTTLSFAQTKKTVKKPVANSTTVAAQNSSDGIFAEFETSKGKIVIRLEYVKTPVTVANFISLIEGTNSFIKDEKLKGKPFYDGLKFHRVIADFMIQGGDPLGNGSGGPGYAFKDEITDLKHDKGGILSMANSGPKTNGSQFFITHKATPWLDGKHTVFGSVVSGMEVVNTIVQDDVITKVTVIRKGADAKKFDAAKVFSTYLTNKDAEEKLQREKEENDRAIVNANALKEFANAQTTASGLKYIVLKEGTGATPASATTNVKVHYIGWLASGTEIDNSIKRGVPADFGLNQVIKGWTEGLQLMKEGSKYKFYIPYQLAWGDKANGDKIPAKSDVIFEVELLKINN